MSEVRRPRAILLIFNKTSDTSETWLGEAKVVQNSLSRACLGDKVSLKCLNKSPLYKVAEPSASPVIVRRAEAGISSPLEMDLLPGSNMFMLVFMLALLPTFILLLLVLSWLLLLLLLLKGEQ